MILYLVIALNSLVIQLPHKITSAKVVTYPSPVSVNATIGADAFVMRKLIINSPKYGKHEVLVDDEDYSMVSYFTWILAPRDRRLYAYTAIGGRLSPRRFYLHQLIMKFPKTKIDHRNRNGLHNYKSNLRLATNSQNSMNSDRSRTNSSGHRGVYWRENRQKWHAQIRIKNKQTFIGYFDFIIDAAKAYNDYAIKYHGEFAVLNQIL